MGNYFKPWRRKAGVVTLGLASMMTAIWVRREGNFDLYAIALPNEQAIVFATLNGRMGCDVEPFADPPLVQFNKIGEPGDMTLDDIWNMNAIPCWTVAVPLTLLSALLLLWPQRRVKPPTSPSPT